MSTLIRQEKLIFAHDRMTHMICWSQDLARETSKDPYSQWCFQDVFHEDCIVLDPVSVLPVQYEITDCLIPVSQGKWKHLELCFEMQV